MLQADYCLEIYPREDKMAAKILGQTPALLKRRERTVFIFGSTVLFALIIMAALLVYSDSMVQAKEQVVAKTEQTQDNGFGTVVLVAPTSRIPKGVKLTSGHLREVSWPRDQVPEGAVRSLNEIIGMYTADALPANQPIANGSVAVTPPTYGIGELLPPGHRAVTIEVDAITGVEGWATPGAHVDVYLTHRDQETGIFKTRVAVEDAVVLSYGGETRKLNQTDGERTKIQNTVTLAVAFADSLKIQTAKAVGKITLALRNSSDVASQGSEEFAATDWEGQAPKQIAKDTFVSKGFAKYTDSSGSERQFVLGNDERWWKNSGE